MGAIMIALLLMSGSGCRSAQRERNRGEENPLPSMTLTEADKGKSITAKPGDTIAISLPENPSTGFRWALEARSDAHLELVDSTYIAAPGTAAGRAGRHVWNFKIRQAGDVRLALKLWRAWEGDKSIADRFDVTIVSRP